MKKLILAAGALAACQSIWAAAFTNGSFESFNAGVADALCPSGAAGCAQFNAGNTGIASWTIGGAGVDVVGTLWPASAGSYSLDLNAGGPGSISQTFDTVANQVYLVTFDLGGNYFANPQAKTGTVSAAASSQALSFTNATIYPFADGPGNPAMGWSAQTFSFTALGNSTTLTFTGTNGGSAGLALDNISVTAVPEPSGYVLALASLGLLGFTARRRRL